MKTNFRNVLLATVFGFISFGNAAADLSVGLIAHYPFNGNANDESGNGNHGTVYGSVLAEDRFGNQDSAYYFDGIDDYIQVEPIPGATALYQWTISAWIKPAEIPSTAKSIFTKKNPSGGGYNYLIVLTPEGDLKGAYEACGDEFDNDVYAGITVDQAWQHVVVSFNAEKQLAIFVNGTLRNEEAYIMEPCANDEPFGIGWNLEQEHSSAHFHGDIDDVRLYSRPLSESEVRELFDEGISSKPEIRIDDGFINFSVTNGSFPEAGYCFEADHYGRTLVDEINNLLYICTTSGWISK